MSTLQCTITHVENRKQEKERCETARQHSLDIWNTMAWTPLIRTHATTRTRCTHTWTQCPTVSGGLSGHLEVPDGTICCNWGNLLRHPKILMQHCGLESKVKEMKYYKGCHSWANSAVFSMELLHELYILFSFIPHCIHRLPLFLFHTWIQYQGFWLPLALSSVTAIKDVTNPVDVLNPVSSATNSTRKSVPRLSGCGPSGSQGLVLSSWHGLGNWDSWGPWPPGLQQPTYHHQQPIRQGDFHFKPHRNRSKFPAITSIVVS